MRLKPADTWEVVDNTALSFLKEPMSVKESCLRTRAPYWVQLVLILKAMSTWDQCPARIRSYPQSPYKEDYLDTQTLQTEGRPLLSELRERKLTQDRMRAESPPVTILQAGETRLSIPPMANIGRQSPRHQQEKDAQGRGTVTPALRLSSPCIQATLGLEIQTIGRGIVTKQDGTSPRLPLILSKDSRKKSCNGL